MAPLHQKKEEVLKIRTHYQGVKKNHDLIPLVQVVCVKNWVVISYVDDY